MLCQRSLGFAYLGRKPPVRIENEQHAARAGVIAYLLNGQLLFVKLDRQVFAGEPVQQVAAGVDEAHRQIHSAGALRLQREDDKQTERKKIARDSHNQSPVNGLYSGFWGILSDVTELGASIKKRGSVFFVSLFSVSL